MSISNSIREELITDYGIGEPVFSDDTKNKKAIELDLHIALDDLETFKEYVSTVKNKTQKLLKTLNGKEQKVSFLREQLAVYNIYN